MLKFNDEVILVYTPEDLESEDLGMSGIVLHSSLKQFSIRLDDTFRFEGYINEALPRCVLSYQSEGGFPRRYYVVSANYVKAKPIDRLDNKYNYPNRD